MTLNRSDDLKQDEFLSYLKTATWLEKAIQGYLTLPNVADSKERILNSALYYLQLGMDCSEVALKLEKHIELSCYCYKGLVKNKQIPKNIPWRMTARFHKDQGGIRLINKNNNVVAGQVVITCFHKLYRRGMDELEQFYNLRRRIHSHLMEYALMTIAKRCGISTPDVDFRVKPTEIFRADQLPGVDLYFRKSFLAPNKVSQRKTYQFFNAPYIPADHSTLDPVSVARMLLISGITGLNLDDKNVGGVVRRYNDDSKNAKTKIALIHGVHTYYSSRFYNAKENQSLIDILRGGNGDDGHSDDGYSPEVKSIISNLTTESFIKAFTKIERNFNNACEYLLKEIQVMELSECYNKIQILHLINLWQSAFKSARQYVKKAEDELHCSSRKSLGNYA